MNTHDIAANTTLAQLGGRNRLKVMVGLKACYHDNDGRTLKLQVMKGRHVAVTIEADDTYTVQVTIMNGRKVTERDPVAGVYVDSLFQVLEAETGLAWRL